jgi:hypothetical protein
MIERYRVLGRGVTDQAALDAIAFLIEQMETTKASLHPEDD